jgi:glucose/arabinose dehydrogenase/PKD repeat protein
VVFSGLTQPTAVRFASDGRIFVAEKSGIIKVFDNLTDTSPTIFADLNVNVYNFWDRGLLGLALHPNFPADPRVYVLYSYDHCIPGVNNCPSTGRWGTADVYSEGCPNPPGATAAGCVVYGRLSVLDATAGDVTAVTASEQVLIGQAGTDWCQQYPSHSIGDLAFGPDGKLYVTGGDGASFNVVDWGQQGNPCNDPLQEGGALRSQDLRTTGDPVALNGAALRVDPGTGDGLSGNPFVLSTDANARRIIAYGLRNPFRMTFHPGTNELWIGDVGWNDWEEINVISNATSHQSGAAENFGWPCYEGRNRQSGYDGANLTVCESLYGSGSGAVTTPYFAYHHSAKVVDGESCPTGSSATTGLAFEFQNSNAFGADYQGALFFADYSRNCIWAIKNPDRNTPPAPGQFVSFVQGAASPVDLKIGPGDDLFYADLNGGTIRRIHYLGSPANNPPTAVATAFPTSGSAPLTVTFDGSQSSDPDRDTLTYAWDLDGDGQFDDSTLLNPAYMYTASGIYTVTLKVTDPDNASDTATVVITVGNTPPVAHIDTAAPNPWKVGDTINFSGGADDTQDGNNLPASQLSWSVVLQHCPTTCHPHTLQTFDGVSSGSFTAPDHEYPSYLELSLTATDSGGLTDTESVRLDPKTVVLHFATKPVPGLQLTVGSATQATRFDRTVIIGSSNTITALSPQQRNKKTYTFVSWSDGGLQTHVITAPAASTTYTATYQ